MKDLEALIERARAEIATMTPEQRKELARQQAESWARGEIGIGLDRAEADWCKAQEGRE